MGKAYLLIIDVKLPAPPGIRKYTVNNKGPSSLSGVVSPYAELHSQLFASKCERSLVGGPMIFLHTRHLQLGRSVPDRATVRMYESEERNDIPALLLCRVATNVR